MCVYGLMVVGGAIEVTGGAGGNDSGGQQDDDDDDDEDDHHEDHDQLGVLPPVGASHFVRRLLELICLRTTRQTGEATNRKQTSNSSTCPCRELQKLH